MQRAILVGLTLLLAACNPSPPPPDATVESADDNVIGAPLEQALDKARSVEDLGVERKVGLDEAIDEAN